MAPSTFLRSRQFSSAAVLALLQATAQAGYVTNKEIALDAIYGQAGFGANAIDLRYHGGTAITNAALTTIDDAADWALLLGLAGNYSSPVVNMYFVDKILWCGTPAPTAIGCASTPGNVLALDSSWAANATYGANLAAHELAHNLGLPHLGPDNGSNLMNATISTSFALNAAQITTILASPLVRVGNASEKFIDVSTVAVVPEPARWLLWLLGGAAVATAVRRAPGRRPA